MKSQIAIASGIVLAALATTAASIPAYALTTKECSAKYQAAKKAGTLNGMKWGDFRKAECGAQASAAPASSGPAPAPAPAAAAAPAEKRAARTPAPAPAVSGNAVFPSAVDSKYANESAGRARLHTCADQYKANKVSNANGGLKWIEKGGGYWSECDKHLKGSA